MWRKGVFFKKQNKKTFLPKRECEPDGSQLDCVVFHWVAEAFHECYPDLLKKKKKASSLFVAEISAEKKAKNSRRNTNVPL